jgi:aspartyl-tRNA(Asn)/glutamyl-tRNA(Gln) amidotransferase subunit B
MFTDGGQPETIAEEHGLLQTSDTDKLESVIEETIDENPDVVEQFKNGKESTIQFFIGQGMQKTGGSANPEVLKKLFQEKLPE